MPIPRDGPARKKSTPLLSNALQRVKESADEHLAIAARAQLFNSPHVPAHVNRHNRYGSSARFAVSATAGCCASLRAAANELLQPQLVNQGRNCQL